MNTVFEILPDNIEPSRTNLICEISEQGIAYLFQDIDTKEIKGLSVYRLRLAKDDLCTRLEDLFKEVSALNINYHNIYISYSFSENVLLPEEIEEENHFKALELLSGDRGTKIDLKDRLTADKMYNVYRVPGALHNAILKQFPNAIFTHQYSYLLRALFKKGNVLHVTFYPNKMVCVLVLNGILQLLNSFTYITKDDAAYHLLNIRHQYRHDDFELKLSGMIEESSPLYTEVYKYFLQVSFAEHQCDCSEGIKKYPSHYFSHLLSVASCV